MNKVSNDKGNKDRVTQSKSNNDKMVKVNTDNKVKQVKSVKTFEEKVEIHRNEIIRKQNKIKREIFISRILLVFSLIAVISTVYVINKQSNEKIVLESKIEELEKEKDTVTEKVNRYEDLLDGSIIKLRDGTEVTVNKSNDNLIIEIKSDNIGKEFMKYIDDNGSTLNILGDK